MDPERPIEKLLRACAEKRRQQAQLPSEVHPATRRLLQGEVARQFGRGETRQPRGWWSSLFSMPRLAWVASGAAVVVLSILVLAPRERTQHQLLAKNDLTTESKSGVAQPQPLAAGEAAEGSLGLPRAAEMEADKSKALAVSAEVSKRAEVAKDVASASFGAKTEMPSTFAANGVSTQAYSNAPAASGGLAWNATAVPEPTFLRSDGLPAPTAAAEPAPAPAAPVALSDREQTATARFGAGQGGAALSKATAPTAQTTGDSYSATVRGSASSPLALTFVRTPARSRLASRPTASPSDVVLASFTITRDGDRVQVTDQDGSVYSGSLQTTAVDSLMRPVATENARTEVNRRLALKGSSAPKQPFAFAPEVPAGYVFWVAGTNKSLNQKVVFTGSLWPVTNGVGKVKSTNRLAVPDQAWLIDSRVSGKAVINDRQQVDINAAPATR